jgi:two-component system chemotaxis sensor kinase CheA
VVIRHAGRRFGLVVDELLGEMQTVIKPLTRMCGHVTGIAGSTILGDGSIALIFDIPELMAFAQSAAVSASRTGTVAKAASCP